MIEHWWKELHERLEKYYKEKLVFLKDEGHYNPSDAHHRDILAFIFIPILEEEMKIFTNNWNTHRTRHQKTTCFPDGIPNHIYDFPEKYGMEECGLKVTEEQLRQVAEVSIYVLAVCAEIFLEDP